MISIDLPGARDRRWSRSTWPGGGGGGGGGVRVRATVGPIRCASGHGPAGARRGDGRAVPRTRPIELPVALLLATAAFAFSVAGACAVLLAGLVVAAGHAEVVLRTGWPTWCAAAALGCANAAGLLALTRRSGGLHPLSLAAAWLLGFAVPAHGRAGARRAGGRRRHGPGGTARRAPRPRRRTRLPAAAGARARRARPADGRVRRRRRRRAASAPPRARRSRPHGPRSARRRRRAVSGPGAARDPSRSCARTTARSTTAPSTGPGARSRRPSGAASAASTAGARASPPRFTSRPSGLRTVRAGDARIVGRPARGPRPGRVRRARAPLRRPLAAGARRGRLAGRGADGSARRGDRLRAGRERPG